MTLDLASSDGSFGHIDASFYYSLGEHAEVSLDEKLPNENDTLEPWTVGHAQIVMLAELLAHTAIGEGD